SDILAARGRTVAGVSEPELVRLQLATTAVSRIKDQLSITRGLVDEALVVGKLSVDLRRELAGANSDLEAWRSEFETFATPEQERTYDDKRSEEHTSELQSRENLVCRLPLGKKNETGNGAVPDATAACVPV